MRLLAVLALLSLSSCAGGSGASASADPALRQCQGRAVNDPAVQAAILRANSPLQEVRVQGVHDQAVAIKRAVHRCLAARGLAPAGGVEPVEGDWLGPPLL